MTILFYSVIINLTVKGVFYADIIFNQTVSQNLFLYVYFSFLCNCYIQVGAIGAGNDEIIFSYEDQDNIAAIDELLALRSKLEVNYSEHETQIIEIDRILENLGLEIVSPTEIMNKLGGIMPAIDIPSTGSIRWTSRRINGFTECKHCF